MLSSDLDFCDVKPFILDYDAIDRQHDVLLVLIDTGAADSVLLSVQGF